MTDEDTIKRVVRETLLQLGINTADADAVTEVQEDFAYLRKARKGSEEVGKWVRRSLIGTGLSAAVYVAWEGFKAALHMKAGQ